MADGTDDNGGPNVDELRDQLDALWEKHLTLLDSYHQTQQQIARHFSSGFFDLAQATFKSTTRVRYGQESYDDRMQATTSFDASVDDHDIPCLALKVNDTTPQSPTDESTKSTNNKSDEKAINEEGITPSQQPTPPSTPRKSDDELPEEQSQENKSDTTGDKEPSQKKVRDPINWYGILVPPSLRSSQKSFKSAIQDPIIEAANSAQALRHINMEIRKLRKDIKKAEKRVS